MQRQLGRKREARVEVLLFLLCEDAAREAGEVASRSGNEASNPRDMDDVGADVEGEGEGKGWFHCALSEGRLKKVLFDR